MAIQHNETYGLNRSPTRAVFQNIPRNLFHLVNLVLSFLKYPRSPTHAYYGQSKQELSLGYMWWCIQLTRSPVVAIENSGVRSV